MPRRLAADLTPLRRYPDYRRLWTGVTVSFFGTQLTVVAVQLQVYDISHSSFAVGLVGLFGLLGLVGMGLYGGAIADAVDRRRLTMVTSSGLAVLSALLVVQAVVHARSVALLYAIVLVQSTLFAVDSPGRGAMVPRLVAARDLPAANALTMVSMNLGLALGPVAAGFLVHAAGYGSAYAVDTASFAAAFYAIWRLPAMAPEGGGSPAGLSSVREGLRFLRTRPVLLMTFLVDIDAMVFGMPRALFPAVARGFYGGGASTAGLLYAAPGFGALVGALLGGWLTRVRRQGLAVVVGIVVWGAAIAGFGLLRVLWVGLLLLAVAGAADMVSAVFRNTILQVLTPDALRGRLQGVFTVVVAGGPRLGDVEAGAVAAAFTPGFSVVSGGVACILGVLVLAAAVPKFVRYDAVHPAD